jgi:hypothetical protein
MVWRDPYPILLAAIRSSASADADGYPAVVIYKAAREWVPYFLRGFFGTK